MQWGTDDMCLDQELLLPEPHSLQNSPGETVPCAVLCRIAPSCPTLFNPKDCSLPGSSVHGDSPDKNTGMGCHALLQGIFPTQGSNPSLPHCSWILYRLSYQGSPASHLGDFKFSGIILKKKKQQIQLILRL
ncbi:unnamed protein product [Rangifer tarandus platyrhynchus]|uniref:Uncharacterized protein n=2 Tax=Rangifer tarandus platyrhynchus TaxID=3082113 RepID=A0AC59Y070_RANTA|nr:unnamed protein product [Rangifer tarandus platyrhynchus]